MSDSPPSPTPDRPEITTSEPPPGFSPGVGRYVAQLTEIRAELLRHVAGLNATQLSWHPQPNIESIGTQLLHVAAIEWSWIFQDIFGRPDADYDNWEEAMPIRISGAQVAGKPLTYFTDRLARVRQEITAAIQPLTDADLPRLVGEGPTPEGIEPRSYLFSIDWILFHVVHHEAHHAGQVELLVRMLPPELATP